MIVLVVSPGAKTVDGQLTGAAPPLPPTALPPLSPPEEPDAPAVALPADPPAAAPAVGAAPPVPLKAPALPGVGNDMPPDAEVEPAIEVEPPLAEEPAALELAPAIGAPGAPPDALSEGESLPHADTTTGSVRAKSQRRAAGRAGCTFLSMIHRTLTDVHRSGVKFVPTSHGHRGLAAGDETTPSNS